MPLYSTNSFNSLQVISGFVFYKALRQNCDRKNTKINFTLQFLLDPPLNMIGPEFKDLWTPTGLILGFQVTLFKWRLEREAEVGDKDDIPWLVPSDYISIAGMLILVFGVILLPLSGRISETTARMLFGLGILFFVGQALGLAGHYQLYNRSKKREFVWFPRQEKILIFLTVLAAATYLILVFR